MINKLTIENFQSHRDTSLELDPGVNIIVGSTDSGKTAIIRALRWMVWNRPSGDAFRSSWGGDTQVVAEIGDDIINRIKTDRDNLYLFNEEEARAFGADVPDDIIKALNMDEINLQQQLDRPFLLTDSPGEVARHFNRVANLDKIDEGVRQIQRELRQVEQDIRSTDSNIAAAEQELTQYDHLDKMEVDVSVLEDMEKDIAGLGNSMRTLGDMHTDIIYIQRQIEEFDEFLHMEEEVDAVIELFTQQRRLGEDIQVLSALITEVEEVEEELLYNRETLQMEAAVTDILSLTDESRSLSNDLSRLRQVIQRVEGTTENASKAAKRRDRLQEEFHEMMPDTCPLCDQKIKKL